MSLTYEDLLNDISGSQSATPSYDDLLREIEPQTSSGFTQQEGMHYQNTLSQPEGPKIQPFEEKRIALEMRKKYPELKKYNNQKVIDVYHEMQRHRLRGVGEYAAKGALGALDLPQAIASLATLGKYKPNYVSQDIQKFLKEKGIDLNTEQALTPEENLVFKGTEWGSSALGGAGLGKGVVKGLTPAAKASQNIPYLGKTVSGAQKTAGALYGAPATGNELALQTALATGLGTTAGELENLGLSPEQASLVGLAPAASGLARGLVKAPYGKANNIRPSVSGENEALKFHENINAQRLADQQSLSQAKEGVKESLGVIPKDTQQPQFGSNIRNALSEQEKILKSERYKIAGPRYTQLENITDRPPLSETNKYIQEKISNLDSMDPLNETISNTARNLALDSEVPLTAGQVEKKMRVIEKGKNNAWKSGDMDAYGFYEDTLKHMGTDLEVVPEIKKIRQAYAELSDPINKLRTNKDINKILKKNYKNYIVLDSEVPDSLIKLGRKTVSSQKQIYETLSNDSDVIDQVRAYNFKNLYNKVVDLDGNVNLASLNKYIQSNPGLFIWDPSLRNKLKGVNNAQEYFNSVKQNVQENLRKYSADVNSAIKPKESSWDEVLTGLTSHGGLGSAAGWILGHSLHGAVAGSALYGAAKRYKKIKHDAFSKKLKSLEKK